MPVYALSVHSGGRMVSASTCNVYGGCTRAWHCQAVRHSTHLWGIARHGCCVACAAQGPCLAKQSPKTRGTAHGRVLYASAWLLISECHSLIPTSARTAATVLLCRVGGLHTPYLLFIMTPTSLRCNCFPSTYVHHAGGHL